MKRIWLLIIAFVCFINSVAAQKAVLSISLKNSTATSCHLSVPKNSFNYGYLKKGSFDIPIDHARKGLINIELSAPVFASLYVSASDSSRSDTRYGLYLSPGDQLSISVDLKTNQFKASGRGSANNQPLLAALEAPSLQKFYGDTLPGRVIAAINKYQTDLRTAFAQYTKTYKPTADFIRNETENIRYAGVNEYFDFKENNKYGIGKAYTNNMNAWTMIQDSLFKEVKLNNSEAITSKNYIGLVRTFILRKKEQLWQEAYKNPIDFYRIWYNADTSSGKKLFNNDVQNRLQQKIVLKYFTGAVQEYGYALVIDDALGEHNPQNIVSIFDDFKKGYPGSKYVKWFARAIDTIKEKEKQGLTKDMLLLPGNGSNLNTFAEVRALAKGKTVLLDMWGTWCGPCRNEINDNSAAIKAFFKGRGLDYFYVANRDLNHEDNWKKLIGYFNLTGTHILANSALSKDIMTTVKGTGYPTYVIIKKDGSWELSKAGFPMKRDMLIKQLDDALAMK